jgi:hypothetical protein
MRQEPIIKDETRVSICLQIRLFKCNTHTVWPARGPSATFGARIDGVSSHDLIGGSESWRLPGYNVSIEPGLSIARGKNSFSLTVPVVITSHGYVLSRVGTRARVLDSLNQAHEQRGAARDVADDYVLVLGVSACAINPQAIQHRHA